MKNLKRLLAMFLIFAISGAYALAETDDNAQVDLSPLGFEFGISKKDAKKVIESKGKRIIEDKVDSKKIRVIVMQGVIVDLPVNTEGLDVQTRLEFFDKKLLSTSLIFNAEDTPTEEWLEEAFSEYFYDRYSEPSERDHMMYFKTWTWDLPKVKLVLNTNTKDKIVKVDYTYEPIKKAKYEEELKQKRGTEDIDPAKKMFLDGDYSKPTDYDDRYKAPNYQN